MATRAVHIEVVPALTSIAFLMSLHRFVARRGLPDTLFSDCGTNFVGANNHLSFTDDSIQRDSAIQEIKWIFNPPCSPHRGGIWEAAVKAAKTHLVRVIGSQTLNYDEYNTLFARIESILNSRPLCYRQSSSNADNFVLTPSHFLISSLPYILPEPEESHLPYTKRYDLLHNLIASFWKVWRFDFLSMLQKKEKWLTSHPNIQPGQVVLIKDAAPPNTWPMAIVESTTADTTGKVRTVTLRTKAGSTFNRDIRSLIRLPIDVQEPDGSSGESVDVKSPACQ